jgi:hypothetical protein
MCEEAMFCAIDIVLRLRRHTIKVAVWDKVKASRLEPVLWKG